jgi:hypothetical protein
VNKYNPATSVRHKSETTNLIIYKVTNLLNGKIYIGQTINTLEHRRSGHYRDTNSRKVNHGAFHNALKKYPEDAFVWEIIDTAESVEELNRKEQYWIAYYDSTNKEKGYNRDSGGANCKKSPETRRKIGDTTIEKLKNPEIKQKILEGLQKGTQVWKQICRSKRVEWVCPYCGTVLHNIPPYMAKNRKVCSLKCPGVNYMKGIDAANRKARERADVRFAIIKKYILEWCAVNRDKVYRCPRNKVETIYSELVSEIKEKYRIKDFRSMIRTVTGSYSRKVFAQYIDEYLETL